MENELLLLIKKHTDTLIDHTKTKPQETLEYKMKQQMQKFAIILPVNFSEKGKWLLAVTSFDATNTVFNKTDENNSFSISIPGQWSLEGSQEIVDKLYILLELRSRNDIELHVKEVEKKIIRIETENSGYNLAGFDHFKGEILARIKRVNYKDLEDMVQSMELTKDDFLVIFDIKYIAGSTSVYTLPPGISEISDSNLMLKS